MDIHQFIIKGHYSVPDIEKKGKELFAGEFNGKIFRTQLAYFEDINYSEEVIYMPGFETDPELIKKELQAASLS